MIDYAGIDTDEALRMASLYPAHLMQLKDRGMIKAGYNADLIVFNGEFAIESVFVNGKDKITGFDNNSLIELFQNEKKKQTLSFFCWRPLHFHAECR